MQKKSMPDLERLTIEEFKQANKTPIVLVLDQVRSMNNVGSIFRTADAFLLQAIYLCGFTPQPPHRDINKTALGATETVHWQHFENTLSCIEFLKKEGFIILAIEQVHESILLQNYLIDKNKKYALILGNELEGVDINIINSCNDIIEIPQAGSKHSLNVAVTAGVVSWHFYNAIRL